MRWIWIFVVGCATTSSAPSSTVSDAVLDEWVSQRAPRATPSVRVSVERQRAARARAPRVRSTSGRRIDVAFRRAPLGEALRLLADEARVSLVIADGIEGEVSLRLRSVRPLDAMEALAAAHGAMLVRDGSVVFVRAR